MSNERTSTSCCCCCHHRHCCCIANETFINRISFFKRQKYGCEKQWIMEFCTRFKVILQFHFFLFAGWRVELQRLISLLLFFWFTLFCRIYFHLLSCLPFPGISFTNLCNAPLAIWITFSCFIIFCSWAEHKKIKKNNFSNAMPSFRNGISAHLGIHWWAKMDKNHPFTPRTHSE